MSPLSEHIPNTGINENHATVGTFPPKNPADFHLQAMELFTLTLSHELKNSLSKIRMAVSLASAQPPSQPVTEYIRIIESASEQMERTLAGLNELVKFKHELEAVKEFNPLEHFKVIRNEFREKLDSLKATLSIELAHSTRIKYIESYFRTIISNLVSNAVKYAYRNRPLNILVTEDHRDGEYILTFRDNGAGIDLSDGPAKIFEPFSRMNFHTEGTGLGLYIIKSMIELNGGRVQVESAPGVGTTFTCCMKEY